MIESSALLNFLPNLAADIFVCCVGVVFQGDKKDFEGTR